MHMHKLDAYGEVGGWMEWRWFTPRYARAGRRLWVMPFVSIHPYREYAGLLCAIYIAFGFLGWNGQLWWQQRNIEYVRKVMETLPRPKPPGL